jgi:hypothetical protein
MFVRSNQDLFLRRRSSRLEVRDECHADLSCPDFTACWYSQLGWLAKRPTQIAQNAAGIIRRGAEIAPCLEQQPGARDLAQSQAAEYRLDRRHQRADNVRPRATHGRQGANDARHHRLHAVEPRNRHNKSQAPTRAASGSDRKHPDRSDSQSPSMQSQMSSGDPAAVATNCEHRRSAWA